MASEKVTRVWEAAYRHYGRAWEATARSGKGDLAAAREMAAASWAVAAAWRQIAAATTLPWWALAAIESAAGAFESQAREYETGKPTRDHHHGQDHQTCDTTDVGGGP
jgi:lysozyme family protein